MHILLNVSDMIDRNTTPRMPWHDVGIYTQGLVARDIARHFILRWNHAKVSNPCLTRCKKTFRFKNTMDSSRLMISTSYFTVELKNVQKLIHWLIMNFYTNMFGRILKQFNLNIKHQT